MRWSDVLAVVAVAFLALAVGLLVGYYAGWDERDRLEDDAES